MKLTLKNVARISSAEIDISGITVIAGLNGVGKSTISRAAMTLCSVSSRLPTLVQRERMSSIFNALRETFGKFGGDIFTVDDFPGERRNFWGLWFSSEWWKNLEGVCNWFRDNSKGQEGLVIYPERFLEAPKFEEALRDALPKVLEIVDRDEGAYVGYVCMKSFRRAFRNQIRPLHKVVSEPSSISILDERNKVSIAFNDDGIVDMTEMGRTIAPTTVYLEPLHFMDFVDGQHYGISDRYTAGNLCVCKVISRPPPKNLSLEEDDELKETRAILREIVGVIHGRLVDDEETVRFKENGVDHTINLKNIASGMKTMAAVVRAVENRSIRRGSLLIIDEPESNLHPEWQVKFAIFLVLLQKRLGVSILLNTHSPYFLRAISVYTKDSEVESHFYRMIPDQGELKSKDIGEESLKSYHSDPVDGNLEDVFRDMARPFDNLI